MSTNAKPEAPAAAAPKAGIVWIASFPKSGNTWTRTFLHNLLQIQAGEDGAPRINEMNRFSTWDVNRKHYEDMLGYAPGPHDRQAVAATRPRVQQQIADANDGIVFIKTHHALVMDRGHSAINFAVTSGAIYIVRNPLDVAISYAHHLDCPVDLAIEMMATENLETDITDKAVYEVCGSWSQHVWSWTRKPHRTIHVMRYEDMLAAPHQTFAALARHLLFDCNSDQIGQAVDNSSFDKLRTQEEQEGFVEKPEVADRFFREGRSGQWKERLTGDQINRIVRDHGEQMQRFGYLQQGRPI